MGEEIRGSGELAPGGEKYTRTIEQNNNDE